MVENVKEVINATFEEVNSSSLVLKLLDAYSKLFAHGAQLGGCSLCLRDYYNELKLKGLEMAEKYEEVQKRTCVPNWTGLNYKRETARHYSDEWITDNEAVELLKAGVFTKNEFKVLPEGYTEIEGEVEATKPERKKKQKVEENEQTA